MRRPACGRCAARAHRRPRGRPGRPSRSGAGVDRRRRRTAASEPDLGRGWRPSTASPARTSAASTAARRGYLGSQPVDLTPTDDWPEFFLERRVRPLTARAVELGRIDPAAPAEVDRIAPRAAERCGPPEPPALLHGDLWAGNRLVDVTGVNWLIDPAAYVRPPRGRPGHDAAVRGLRRRHVRRLRRGVPAGRRLARPRPLVPARRRCWCTPSCSAGPTAGPPWTCSISSQLTPTDDTRRHHHHRRPARRRWPTSASPGSGARAHPTGDSPADDAADVAPIEMPGMVNVSTTLIKRTVPRPVDSGFTPRLRMPIRRGHQPEHGAHAPPWNASVPHSRRRPTRRARRRSTAGRSGSGHRRFEELAELEQQHHVERDVDDPEVQEPRRDEPVPLGSGCPAAARRRARCRPDPASCANR